MRTIISLLTILIAANCAFATAYLIEDGDNFMDLTLYDYDTLLMTGGEGHHLDLFDYSSAVIEGTAPLISEGNGGIWLVRLGGYTNFEMSGGEINQLDVGSQSRAVLSGGRIDNLWSYQYVPLVPEGGEGSPLVPDTHIEVLCRDWDYNDITRMLTGTWEDFSTFSIYLSPNPEINSGFDPAIDNFEFTIIPEPLTILLLGLGASFIRRRV